MPFGPGTYGDMGGGGLAAPALQRQGIPQPIAAAPPTADPQALSEALAMLKGGQVGAERFLQVLALLAGQILPQMQQQGAPAGAPPGAMGGGGAPSIQDLLG